MNYDFAIFLKLMKNWDYEIIFLEIDEKWCEFDILMRTLEHAWNMITNDWMIFLVFDLSPYSVGYRNLVMIKIFLGPGPGGG